MRKGRDGEWKMEKKNGKKMENNGENSGPLTSLPVDRLTATDCNADRSCQFSFIIYSRQSVKISRYYNIFLGEHFHPMVSHLVKIKLFQIIKNL